MPTLGKYKNILIAIALSCILYLGYVYLAPAAEDAALVPSGGAAGADLAVDRELLTLLSDIRQIKLDASLFTNPVFQSLEDYGQTIPNEAVGRANPFAPIGK